MSVLQMYVEQLEKLRAEPFRMGLPEEIQQIKNHIKTLPKTDQIWDGDLGVYEKVKQEEYWDL